MFATRILAFCRGQSTSDFTIRHHSVQQNGVLHKSTQKKYSRPLSWVHSLREMTVSYFLSFLSSLNREYRQSEDS